MSSRKEPPVSIRFEEDELNRIKMAAAMKGQTVSAYIREKLFSESGTGVGQGDWVLNEIMQATASNTRTLEALKHLVLYLVGRQLSPMDVKKLKRYSLSDLCRSLDPEISDFCMSLNIESE